MRLEHISIVFPVLLLFIYINSLISIRFNKNQLLFENLSLSFKRLRGRQNNIIIKIIELLRDRMGQGAVIAEGIDPRFINRVKGGVIGGVVKGHSHSRAVVTRFLDLRVHFVPHLQCLRFDLMTPKRRALSGRASNSVCLP